MGRILSTLVVFAIALAAPAAAEIYQWTDAEGRAHFTDRLEDVPAAHRRDIRADLEASGRVNVIEGLNPPPAPRGAPSGGSGEPGGGPGSRELAAWMEQVRASGGANPALPGGDAAARQALGGLVGALGLGLVGLTGFLLAGLALVLSVWALCLKLAARLCGQEVPGFGRAFAIAGVQMVAGVVAGALLLLVVGFAAFQDPTRSLQLQGANTGLSFAVNTAVVRGMWSETLGGALALSVVAMLVALGLGIGFALLAALAALVV